MNQSKAAPQSPSVPKKPGPPVLSSDPNMLSNEEAGHHVRNLKKSLDCTPENSVTERGLELIILIKLCSSLVKICHNWPQYLEHPP